MTGLRRLALYRHSSSEHPWATWMQFIVESRYAVEPGIVVRFPYIVISIHDPGRRPARIPRTAGLRGTLCLSFHDAEPTSGMMLPDSIRLMTVADAVWTFAVLLCLPIPRCPGANSF